MTPQSQGKIVAGKVEGPMTMKSIYAVSILMYFEFTELRQAEVSSL